MIRLNAALAMVVSQAGAQQALVVAVIAEVGVAIMLPTVTVISVIAEVTIIHTVVAAIDMHPYLRRLHIPYAHIINIKYIVDVIDRLGPG